VKNFLLIVLLVLTPISQACSRPSNIVTPAGKAAYDADQVVLRLKELSDVVKADTGTQPGNIRPTDAFTIIEWISGDDKANPPTTGVVQAVQTTVGQGWKAAAKQGWTTRIRALFDKYPKLQPYTTIVDALLEVM
jgi:hypothetical protein